MQRGDNTSANSRHLLQVDPSVRELAQQVRELRAAIEEMRAEAAAYRAETAELRRELEATRGQTSGSTASSHNPPLHVF